MIKLTNLEKIYRTKEIETVALENVNLDIQKMTAAAVMLVILTGGILGAEEWWKNHTKKIEERRI